MIKKCKKCGKEFRTFKCLDGKYCSRECYLSDRWGTKKCKFCGKPVKGKRYCDKKCRDKYWLKNEYQLIKKKRHWERKIEIINKLGGKCVKCGNKDIRVLDINHINRSKKEKPKSKSGFSMCFSYNSSFRLREWNKNIDNLELLCANCHRIHTWKQMGYGKYNGIDVLEKKNIVK